MLKFRVMRDKGGALIVFGLSKMTIGKLQDGLPIKINLAPLGMEGEIIIFAGDTEESMIKEMQDSEILPAGAADIETVN